MKKFFIAVIALMMTLSASAQFYIYFSDGTVAKVDSISMVAPADAEDPTMPDNPSTPSQGIGVFSVSETNQVTFSPGNLQYHPMNDEWRFAENQWSYIGEANSNISEDYNGWIDMFFWGRGDNPMNNSTDYDDFTEFVDWGVNRIGKDKENVWRTLSAAEWDYLLFSRNNAASLRFCTKVCEVYGLVLLPDNMNEDALAKSYAQLSNITLDQWMMIEKLGAIFLPASGKASGYIYMHDVGIGGYYWSSTKYVDYGAKCVWFSNSTLSVLHNYLYYQQSVRLVKDAPDDSEPNIPDPNPDTGNHEYVDLGLSVKWATCNVGASKPEEYGDYFAWGETQPKTTYDWSTYKWCNGSYDTQTKYCTNSSYGTVDNKTILDLSDDAARANWGGSWRMPTDAEMTELREQCTWTWTTQNGVNGYTVTGSNGNSIFLPAAGYRLNSSLKYAGSHGDYWSSSLRTGYSGNACYLYFNSIIVDWGSDYRYYGVSVRPVCQ